MKDCGGTKRRIGQICPVGSGGEEVTEKMTFESRP